MFEQEAEEKGVEYADKQKRTISIHEDSGYSWGQVEEGYENGFKDGAEFGFNKANEWYYPSKGEYPKENKRYLCKIKAFVGGGITYECFDYDIEYNSWKGACGDVIAWKEIIFPAEVK